MDTPRLCRTEPCLIMHAHAAWLQRVRRQDPKPHGSDSATRHFNQVWRTRSWRTPFHVWSHVTFQALLPVHAVWPGLHRSSLACCRSHSGGAVLRIYQRGARCTSFAWSARRWRIFLSLIYTSSHQPNRSPPVEYFSVKARCFSDCFILSLLL